MFYNDKPLSGCGCAVAAVLWLVAGGWWWRYSTVARRLPSPSLKPAPRLNLNQPSLSSHKPPAQSSRTLLANLPPLMSFDPPSSRPENAMVIALFPLPFMKPTILTVFFAESRP